MKADLPAFEAQMQAGLAMLEEHAAQSGAFLCGDTPNQADANLYYITHGFCMADGSVVQLF